MNGNNPTPIQKFSLGATNTPLSSSGGGTTRSVFKDVVVTKMLDGLSVPLLTAAAKGTQIAELNIEVFEIGKSAPFATYKFESVLVTADLLGSSETALSEQVSFNFERIKSEIFLNGTLYRSCYDVKQAASC
jgi:type VI protein secretion system component Hcp